MLSRPDSIGCKLIDQKENRKETVMEKMVKHQNITQAEFCEAEFGNTYIA